ncbi:hypothetical protein BHE74_00059221 [Ensete ventricosum]|nr:hypothetical protein BHE74_00059221 [Ensete ventricosum]
MERHKPTLASRRVHVLDLCLRKASCFRSMFPSSTSTPFMRRQKAGDVAGEAATSTFGDRWLCATECWPVVVAGRSGRQHCGGISGRGGCGWATTEGATGSSCDNKRVRQQGCENKRICGDAVVREWAAIVGSSGCSGRWQGWSAAMKRRGGTAMADGSPFGRMMLLSVHGSLAVPPKIDRRLLISIVDDRLRKKLTVDSRLREKSTVSGRLREKKGRRRRGKEEKKEKKNLLSTRRHRPRVVAPSPAGAFSLARGEGTSPRAGRKI